MIAPHHHWLTRVACTGLKTVEWGPQIFLTSDLPELSVSPDKWEEVHLDFLLGHKKASSFLHFSRRYRLEQDLSLCYDVSGRIFRSAAKSMVVEVSPRLGRVMWSVGIFQGEQEGWPKDPVLYDFVFPSWQEVLEGMETWEDEWSLEERLAFQLHMAQDQEVPHHHTGLLYDGHVPYENFLWEAIDEAGLETENDLLDARQYYQAWLQKGGPDEGEAGRRWNALNISLLALHKTRAILKEGKE